MKSVGSEDSELVSSECQAASGRGVGLEICRAGSCCGGGGLVLVLGLVGRVLGLFLTRIRDSRVIDGAKGLGDRVFDLVKFGQGQVGLVELAVEQAALGDGVDELFKAGGGRFGQAACGAFDAVGEHHDGRFPGLRLGAGVAVLELHGLRLG